MNSVKMLSLALASIATMASCKEAPTTETDSETQTVINEQLAMTENLTEAVEQDRLALVQKIGENINTRRLALLEGEKLASYVHSNNRIGDYVFERKDISV